MNKILLVCFISFFLSVQLFGVRVEMVRRQDGSSSLDFSNIFGKDVDQVRVQEILKSDSKIILYASGPVSNPGFHERDDPVSLWDFLENVAQVNSSAIRRVTIANLEEDMIFKIDGLSLVHSGERGFWKEFLDRWHLQNGDCVMVHQFVSGRGNWFDSTSQP